MKTALLLSILSFNTEHQIRLCDDRKTILESFQLNKVQEKKFNVYYFETPERKLADLGVSVRVRMKKNSAEITVKKRLPDGDSQMSTDNQTICEYDLHGSSKELSCKINASIDKSEIEKVLARQKNWLSVVSKEQLIFLQKYRADLQNAVAYGTLVDHRYQWTDKKFGEITIDLVEQQNKEEIKFDEISVRYDSTDLQKGIEFDKYFKKSGVKACVNQLDWPINKFDTLEILN